MKKYRSLALICALALTVTGCKAQSVDSNSGAAAAAPTVEANSEADMQTAATTTATTEQTTMTLISEAQPEDTDPVGIAELQSYTIGNDLEHFTFDAPAGLEFREESSSISDITLFESYAYNDDDSYTIGVIHLELAYTPGQPQELLDRLGFPGNFYITTECLTETTEGGTAYDIILMALYEDEEKQELHSTGMMGCYPTEHGVLFFGYEMNSQEHYDHYYTIQKQTLDSLIISESTYTEPEQPDTELSGEFQTVVCENEGCTFPVLKEFEYWEDGDDATMWSGMTADENNAVVAGYEAGQSYKEVFSELTYSDDNSDMVLTAEYMYTHDGKEFGFAELALPDFTCLYAMYAVDGGTYIISYNFMGECDEKTKGLIIESFKGFKIIE